MAERADHRAMGLFTNKPRRSEGGTDTLPPPDARRRLDVTAEELAAQFPTLKDAGVVPSAQPGRPANAKYGFVVNSQPKAALLPTVRDLAGGVFTTMEIRGRTVELLAAFDAYQAEHPHAPKGQLVHICCAAADGIVIHDVWESQEALEAWLDSAPGNPRPSSITIHNARITR
jgi:hypothetical protein